VASLTYDGTTWNTTAGNKTYAANSTQAGQLIVVVCANSGRTTANPPTITDNNDAWGQYDLVTAATKNTSADTMWLYIRRHFTTVSTPTTVTMAQSGDTGGGLWVYRLTSMKRCGLAAVRQSGKQDNQAAGTPSITLGQAILTTNPVVGSVMTGSNSTANTAPPTGWAENVDTGYNTPATGRESTGISSGSTLTTVAWTAATPSAFCSLVVEFDASDETLLGELVLAPHRSLVGGPFNAWGSS
jgi:hypothetical protein